MNKASLEFIKPYIPDLLLNHTVEDGKRKQDTIISGSLLFADLSGFTAMSEKLASLGRLGGEKLAEIMNACFNSLLGRVFALDGDVIKFGGDAFLAYFSGDDSINRAYDCAGNLIKWISENGQITTPVGKFSLGIHTGISDGEIYNLQLGEKRREHLFCGETVENCYAAADVAELGELALTESAASKLGLADISRLKDDCYVFDNFDDVPGIDESSRGNDLRKQESETVRDFLVSGLENQLHFSDGSIEGEHRVLTNLFIGVNSLRKNLEADLEKSIEPINRYFTVINDIIERHGGAFARLDSSGSSEKMLIFFGAPLSTGKDAENCLKAILEIEFALKKLNQDLAHPVQHRYGVNTGLCFVGNVGGESRHEYTAMGDAINLAARLMGKAAYGDSIVGEDTLKVCGENFVTRQGDTVMVKGKEKPIQLNYLVKEKTQSSSVGELIIGREDELERAKAFIESVNSGKRSALLISGEPGAGKSLITGRIKRMIVDSGSRYIEGDCFRHSQSTPFIPLKSILLGALGLDSRSTQKSKRQALAESLKDISENEWLPLIAPLLDFFPTVPPQLRNLPEDIKRKKINDIVINILCRESDKSRMILIVEDVQWIDEASLTIIKELLESGYSPGIMFISRPGKVFDFLKEHKRTESIELKGLTPENSRKLFITILDGLVPNEENIKNVIEKSGGNPFYLEEMAKAYLELGADKFSSGENIPTGIESVITARIDNLGEMVKKTVRTASVIGRVFAYNVLKDVFPDSNRKRKLRDYLDELTHLDLTPVERTQPVVEYIFKHILTQEVAYNGLSFSSRQILHLKTAEFFAGRKRYVKRDPELPGRHYLLAGKPEKALPYLFLAGEKAASEFANAEALGFFAKTIEIAEDLDNKEYLIKAIRSRGELAKHISEYKQSESDYERLIELSGDDAKLRALALMKISELNRLTSNYDKALTAIENLEGILPDDLEIQVFCLNGRGEITRRGGKLQDCRTYLLKALDICENYDINPELTAIVYNNLGICHWGLGKMQESAEYYTRALKLYRKLKDLSGQSKVTNNLGIISDEMGKLHQAEKSYEKAERIFKRIGAARMRASACANLGTNLLTRGFLAQAEKRLEDAKEIFEKIGDHHSLAFTYGDLGNLYYRMGDSEKASGYLTEAFNRAQDLKDDEFILESKIRLLRMAYFSGQPSNEDLDVLISDARAIGSTELEIKTMIYSGMIAFFNGDVELAIEIIRKIKKNDSLSDYPELDIELGKFEIAYWLIKGEMKKTVNLANAYLRKAIKSDQAILAIELFTLLNSAGLCESVSPKLSGKVKIYFERIKAELGDDKFRIFTAYHKRLQEVLISYRNHIMNTHKSEKISERIR